MAERTIQPQAARAASWSSVQQMVARHPVAAFLIICYAVNWAVVVPWFRTRTDILPVELQLWESLGTIFGVALPAFLVVAATGGRAGVRDLARRCLRWRVGARWYLVALGAMPIAMLLAATALFGSAPLQALGDNWELQFTLVLPQLLLLIVLFNVAEEIGFTGLLQERWQDRYGPLKASAMVTVPFALFHVPFLFAENGLASALVFLPILAVMHLGARIVLTWLYNSTMRSVLLVGLFHACFNATVTSASKVIPGPEGTAALLGSGIVVVAAVVLVVVTKGRLSYQPKPAVQSVAAPQ
jgi:membrane protease YdiL (CAAX protease family)